MKAPPPYEPASHDERAALAEHAGGPVGFRRRLR